MAVPDHIRARKRPVSRRTHKSQKISARASTQSDRRKTGLTSKIAQEVRLSIAHLHFIHATVITAVAALQKQNADLDMDIALTLQHAVINPMVIEIERLEGFLGIAKEAKC